jgi:hypothetical protein
VTNHWTPEIGDPTFLGWFTVVAYFGAAYLTGCAARRVQSPGPRARLQLVWFGLTWTLILLGLNKQLDLQSLLTITGKNMAMEQGWYAERQDVQFWFIATIVASSVLGGAALAWWLRRELRAVRLAALGAVFIVAFALMRAASFQHVDLLLSKASGGLRMNWLLELSGIGCIALSARLFKSYGAS